MPKRLAMGGLAFLALVLIGVLSAFFSEEPESDPATKSGGRLEAQAPSRPSPEAPSTRRAQGAPADTTPIASGALGQVNSGTPQATAKRARRRRANKRPWVVLTGLVVDPNGLPLAGARVRAQVRGGRGAGDTATSDALGHFVLKLRSLRAWLSVRPPSAAPGLAPGPGLAWRGRALGEVYELAEPLRVGRGVALVGRVRSLEGQPISGASIRAWGGPSRASAKSDTRGEFRLEGLGEATYTLQVEAPGFVPDSRQVPVTLARGGEASFTLSPAGSLAGVVRGSDGQPTPLAEVFAFRGKESILQATANAQGLYALEGLSPGPLEIFVRSRDSALTARLAARVEVGVKASLDLTLHEGARIEGVLRDAEGAPLDRWRVRASSDTGQVRRQGRSDAKGSFSIEDLYPGTYRITARPPDSRGDLVEVEVEVSSGTTRRDLVATLGGHVSGRVLDSEGEAVQAEVHALQGEQTLGFARCDKKGAFLLSDLPPGSYSLFLRRRSRQEGELVGRHALEIAAGERREGLQLSVYRPATVRGRVVAVGVEPKQLGELRVSASSIAGSVDRRGRTDSEGTFSLAPFYDGEYELSLGEDRLALLARDLGVAGLSADPIRVQIEGGQDQEVVLRLRPLGPAPR